MAKKEETKTENPFDEAVAKNKTVTVDGVNYNFEDLSEEAKKQLVNLRIADQEIARLNQLLAITQTARNAYAQALSTSLPKADQANAVQ